MILNYRAVHDYRIGDDDLPELGYVGVDVPLQIKLANPLMLPQISHPPNRPGGVCPEYRPRRHPSCHRRCLHICFQCAWRNAATASRMEFGDGAT